MKATKPINIELGIEIDNDEVIAVLTFLNNSSGIIYLDYWTIGMYKTLINSVLSIKDEEDKYVHYSGMLAKRVIVPEDFIALNPGDSIKTKITINKDYELVKGHTYRIRFCANNPTFPDKQPRLELWSNEVEITYN